MAISEKDLSTFFLTCTPCAGSKVCRWDKILMSWCVVFCYEIVSTQQQKLLTLLDKRLFKIQSFEHFLFLQKFWIIILRLQFLEKKRKKIHLLKKLFFSIKNRLQKCIFPPVFFLSWKKLLKKNPLKNIFFEKKCNFLLNIWPFGGEGDIWKQRLGKTQTLGKKWSSFNEKKSLVKKKHVLPCCLFYFFFCTTWLPQSATKKHLGFYFFTFHPPPSLARAVFLSLCYRGEVFR